MTKNASFCENTKNLDIELFVLVNIKERIVYRVSRLKIGLYKIVTSPVTLSLRQFKPEMYYSHKYKRKKNKLTMIPPQIPCDAGDKSAFTAMAAIY